MDQQTKNSYQQRADIVSAIAHPIRLAIAEYIAKGEICVCDIADYVGANRSNVSRHLAVMLNAGIVTCRKDGLKVYYSLATPCILNFLSCVTDVLRERIQQDMTILEKL